MTKKYKLKPGNHQFAPKSHATHHNDNLTDAEAKWYLERYPHIANLFETMPNKETKESGKEQTTMKNKAKRNNQAELLTPLSGGWGATK